MLPSIGFSRILYSGRADRTSSADRKLGIIRAENFDGEPTRGALQKFEPAVQGVYLFWSSRLAADAVYGLSTVY